MIINGAAEYLNIQLAAIEVLLPRYLNQEQLEHFKSDVNKMVTEYIHKNFRGADEYNNKKS